MTMRTEHPLFQQFPLNGKAQTSVGCLPTPYHIYDGHGLIIGGTADLNVVTELLQTEKIYPLQTKAGKALMAIWVCDFTKASLAPHNELQVAIAVSHQPKSAVEDHPLTLLKALFVDSDVGMLCHGLWNNSRQVVVYNREVLGLNAQLNKGEITRQYGQKSFTFADESGQMILQGQVQMAARSSLKVGWSLTRFFGIRQTMRAFSQSYIDTTVINTLSETSPNHQNASAYLASDTPVLLFFDRKTDHLEFGLEPYQKVDFEPHFVEHFSPFQFVYLCPN